MDFDNYEERLKAARARAEELKQDVEDDLEFEVVEVAEDEVIHRSPMSVRTLNNGIALVVVGFVLIAPIPLGSNRPAAWMTWALLLAVLAMVQVIGTWRLDPDRRMMSEQRLPILALAGALVLGVLLQLLPFAGEPVGALLPENMGSNWSITPAATAMGLVRILSYILLFVIVTEISTNGQRVSRMMWLIFWGILAHGVWAMVSLSMLEEFTFFGEKVAYLGSATGTFVNRNSFATFMAMGLSVGFALALEKVTAPKMRMPRGPKAWSPEKFEILVLFILLAVVVVTVTATQSRMGLAAGAMGAATVYVLMDWKGGSPFIWSLAKAAIAYVIGGVLFILFIGDGVSERLVFAATNAETRFELYRQAWAMFLERPLLGFGLDSFRMGFEAFHKPTLETGVVWDLAHNTYLGNWVELGLIFGSIPVVMGVVLFVALIGIIRRRGSHYTAAIAAVGVMVTAAVHSTADFSLEMAANVYLFITLVAMGSARLRRRPKPPAADEV